MFALARYPQGMANTTMSNYILTDFNKRQAFDHGTFENMMDFGLRVHL